MVLHSHWSLIYASNYKRTSNHTQKYREVLGIIPETEIDFREDKGRFYIIKIDEPEIKGKFKKLRGIATANMSTDEIMSLTRES